MKTAIRYFLFILACGIFASSCRDGGDGRSSYNYAPRENYRGSVPGAYGRFAPEPSTNLRDYLGGKTPENFSIYFISRLSDLATAAGATPWERSRATHDFLRDPVVVSAIRMLANPRLDLSPILERSPIYEKLLTGHGDSVNQSVRKRFLAMLEKKGISYDLEVRYDRDKGIHAEGLTNRYSFHRIEWWLADSVHKFLEEMGFTISSIESQLTSAKFGFAPDDERTRLISKIAKAYLLGLPRSDQIRIQKEFVTLKSPSNVDLVVKALEVVGPAMKKLIQQYAEMVGDPVLREAIRIFKENVKAVPFPEIKERIEQSLKPLGLKFEEVFLDFEEAPINAGVAAQVHRVKIKSKENGRPRNLVIKVLRPDYHSSLEEDREVLSNAKILEMGFDRDFIEKFIEIISAEGDLEHEADNAEKAFSYYHRPDKGVSSVKVVRILGLPTSKDFYFMEEIKAPSFSQLKGLTVPQLTLRLERLKSSAIVWIQEAALGSGFFHADLHGGNMKDDSKNNQAVFYDYGNLGHLEPDQQRGLKQIITSLARFDIEGLFEALPLLLSGPGGSLLPKKGEPSALPEGFRVKAIQKIMQSGPNLVDRVSALLETIGSFQIKIPRNVFQLFRTMTLFESQIFEITQAISAQANGDNLTSEIQDASLQKWLVEGVTLSDFRGRAGTLGRCASELGLP